MEKNDFQCQIHMWMEKMVKKQQYIIRREKQEGGDTKKIIALEQVREYFFTDIDVQFFPFDAIIQHLGLRFRLAFYPTLYKFIVRASWAWIHSCFGFKLNLVLTKTYALDRSSCLYFLQCLFLLCFVNCLLSLDLSCAYFLSTF